MEKSIPAEALQNAGDIFCQFQKASSGTTVRRSDPGLGSFSGFSFILEDQRGTNTIDTPLVANQLMKARQSSNPDWVLCLRLLRQMRPQLQVEIDRQNGA